MPVRNVVKGSLSSLQTELDSENRIYSLFMDLIRHSDKNATISVFCMQNPFDFRYWYMRGVMPGYLFYYIGGGWSTADR